MDLTDTIDNEFTQLASLADEQIDLAHGALLIARAAYPDLNESLYLERLDRMAASVKLDMTADSEPGDIITRLNDILFEQERFRGNRENYYDPETVSLTGYLTERRAFLLRFPLSISRLQGAWAWICAESDCRVTLLPHFITHLEKYSLTRLTGEKSAPSMSAFRSFAHIWAMSLLLIFAGYSRSAEKIYWSEC